MSHFKRLSSKLREIAYEMEVFGIQKEAVAPRLYEYEIDGVKFYMDKKVVRGVRLPIGLAKWTRHFYPVNGALSKALSDEEESKKG